MLKIEKFNFLHWKGSNLPWQVWREQARRVLIYNLRSKINFKLKKIFKKFKKPDLHRLSCFKHWLFYSKIFFRIWSNSSFNNHSVYRKLLKIWLKND